MGLYEENVKIMNERYPEIWKKLSEYHIPEQSEILVGDAQNGDKFLAIEREGSIFPLNSIYDPKHAANRYAIQFQDLPETTTLVLFGFGDGMVIRELLSERSPIHICVVYEPSVTIFDRVLKEYDLTDILIPDKLQIIIQGVNEQNAGYILESSVNYMNWKTFSIAALPVYSSLYYEELQTCFELYQNKLYSKKASLNTGVHFAEKHYKNNIQSMRWLLNSYSWERMENAFPEETPCIIVAAGPSLEKNVEQLKQAKGKSCIIAVDSAVKYLIDHDIYPDFTCTVDPDKPIRNFDDDRMKGMPVFLYTSSNYELLERLQEFDPIYIASDVGYLIQMVGKQGYHLNGIESGGSVATICFSLAATLGFHTIIIIGQDLAYTNNLSHAGTGKVTEDELLENEGICEVEGYYGDSVITTMDFKVYIDWYNQTIPRLAENHVIINATEGGAKLHGAVQMPLEEAVQRFCHTEVDCKSIYRSSGRIWDMEEDRREYYHKLISDLKSLRSLQRYAKEAYELADRACTLVKRSAYSDKEVRELTRNMNAYIDKLNASELYSLLDVRMEESNYNMSEAIHQKRDSVLQEQIALYQMMAEYADGLHKAIVEGIPMWEEVIQDLSDKL